MSSEKSANGRELSELCVALRSLKTPAELKAFLDDLLTPGEIRAISERWAVARQLERKLPYRLISARTGVSTATVTRVARCLSGGAGGYRRALERLGRPQ